MDIWLMRIDPANDWDPLGRLTNHLADRQSPTWGLVLESDVATLPAGTSVWSGGALELPDVTPTRVARWVAEQLATRREDAIVVDLADPHMRLFLATPPRLRNVLLIGGGPDAQPLVGLRRSSRPCRVRCYGDHESSHATCVFRRVVTTDSGLM